MESYPPAAFPAATAPNMADPRAGVCFGGGDLDLAAGHIGVDLHQQFVLLRQTAASHQLMDRHAVLLEGIHDDACAVSGRFDQGAVDFLGLGRQGSAQQQAGQVHIHQDAAVAVPPIECQQAAFARLSAWQPFLPATGEYRSCASWLHRSYDAGTQFSTNQAK